MAKRQITRNDINAIDQHTLADIVYEMMANDPLLYQRIESVLMADKPEALHKELAKRIASIQRGRRFVEYRDSYAFAEEVDAIIRDIERLVESDKEAAKLLKKLILTDEKVYERLDDSGGYVQQGYLLAQEAWQRRSIEAYSESQLLKEIETVLIHEGYGMREVISGKTPQSVLQKLFETVKQRYLEETVSEKYHFSTQKGVLKEIASCLKTPRLYVEALETKGEAIRDYEYLDIALEYQKIEDAEMALYSLQKMQELSFNHVEKYYQTSVWAYERLKDAQHVIESYRRWFERTYSPNVFLNYLSKLNDEKAGDERAKVLETLDKLSFSQRVDFYQVLDEKERCAVYIRASAEKMETRYMHQGAWEKMVEWLRSDYPQEVIMLYRSVVEDHLATSQSKYYPSAVKVLKKISVIENQHDRSEWYLTSNAAFITELREKHAKKSKLMALLDKAFGV